MSKRGILISLLVLTLALPGLAADKVQLTVSSCMADGTPEPAAYTYQKRTLAETFADRISVREPFAAKALKSPRWQAVPEGAEARTHVSVVHVKLGDHHDFIALLHGGPRNSFRFAARAEAIDQSGITYWFSVPTGPRQLERNAPIDLIAHFANQFPGTEVKDDVPVVTLRLKPWSGQEDGEAAGGDMSSEVSLPVLLPVFTAAACGAGLRPTFVETPDALDLRVRAAPGGTAYDVEATLTRKQAKQVRVCRHVAAAELFDTARRQFLSLARPEAGILGVARVSDVPVRPLLVTASAKGDPLVVLAEGETLCARQPVSGEAAWTVAPPKTRGGWCIDQTTGSDGQVRFYAGPGELAQAINPQTGAAKPLPATAASALALTELPGKLALAEARSVRLFAGEKQAWQQETKRPLCAGPALDEKAAYVAETDGAVTALAAADGKALWRVTLPSPLCQPLTVLGGNVLGSTQGGALLALRTADGKTAWQAELGDRLLQPPQRVADGRLLVIVGTNRLLILDEATGAKVTERLWPTWLLAVQPVSAKTGRRLVCVDQRRTVSVLAWPSLETQREIVLPDRLQPAVLECPALPLPWGEHSDMPDPKRVFLVGDEGGYLTIISLED